MAAFNGVTPCLLLLLIGIIGRVITTSPPVFTSLPGDTMVIENRRVLLPCTATGVSNPTVVGWLYNGNRVRLDISLYSLSSDGTLTIPRAARTMAGLYQCIAQNSVGAVISNSFKLTVAYFDQVTTITDNRDARLGSYIILTVPRVNCEPPPKVTWRKNGAVIRESQRISISKEGYMYIANAELSDAGAYVCEVENTYLSSRGESGGKQQLKKYTITISGNTPFTGPVIIKASDPVTATAGVTPSVQLECFVSGSPLAQTAITWRKDGQLLATGGAFTVAAFGKRLIVANPTRQHEGDYSCEALYSTFPRADKRITLSIIVPPQFIELPQDQEAFTDNTTTISCNVTAYPGHTTQWYKNAQALPADARFTIHRNKSLTVSHLRWEDAGMFQCIASNTGGMAVGTARVTVANITTKILSGPRNISIPVGTTVELRCDVQGAPAPKIEWLKDGSRLDPLQRQYSVKENGYLQISNAQQTETAYYTCIATNALGNDRASAYVVVLIPTVITSQLNSTTTSRKGVSVGLECRVSHDPKTLIVRQWRKDNVIINNMRHIVATNGDLMIRDVQESDAGAYSCHVFSIAGNSSASTILQIVEPPLAPSTPVFREVRAKSLRLSWFAPGYDGGSPIISYEVHMRNDSVSGAWYLLMMTETGIQTDVVVTGLRAGAKYQFRVASRNIIGRGRFSIETPFAETTALAPSAPPEGIVVSSGGTDSIHITWKPPPPLSHNGDLLGYHISYRLEGFESSEFSKITVYSANAKAYTITGLPMYTKYEVKLSAFNKAGQGTESAVFSIETREGIPSAPPTNVSVSVVNATSVRVTFSSPPQQLWNGQLRKIKGYTWEPSRPQDQTSYVTVYDPSSFTTQIFIYPKLRPFTEYALAVAVMTSSGESPKSTMVQFKTLEGKPDEPSDVMISGVYADAFTISWKPPIQIAGELQGYHVRFRKADEVPYRTLEEGATSKGAVVRGLLPKTLYEVDVQAYTRAGSGNRVSRTVSTTESPVLPEGPSKPKAFEINSRFIGLGFTPGDSGRAVILNYFIEYNNQSSYHVEQYPIWKVALNLTKILEIPAKIPHLRPNSVYRFRVTAFNSVGASPTSPISDDIRTAEEAPSLPPTNIRITTPERQALLLEWTPAPKESWNSESIRYSIELEALNTTLSTITKIKHPDSTATSYLVRGLYKFTWYNVSISTYNDVGFGPASLSMFARTAEDVPAGPPTNIGARAVDDNRVEVTWGQIDSDLISGVLIGYRIIYNVKDDPITERSVEVIGNFTRKFMLSGLYGYSEYEIRMLGFTRIGNGTKSAPVPVRTFQGVPGKPNKVRFPIVRLDLVRASWRPPLRPNGIIRGYRVQYKLNSTNDAWQSVAHSKDDPNVFSADVGSLAAYKYYAFRVTAETGSGLGESAVEVVYTTDKRGVPESPIIPTIPLSDVGTRSVLVKWLPTKDNNSPIRSFSLQYNEERGGWKIVHDEIPADHAQYSVGHLTPSRSYMFRIKATNDVGNSSWSPSSNAVITMAAAPGGAPTQVRIFAPLPTQLRIEWQAPNPIDLNGRLRSFELKYKQQGSSSGYIVEPIPATTRSFDIKNLKVFTAYELALVAYNDQGPGPWTPFYVRRTGEALPTKPPSNVRLEVVGTNTIKVVWDHPPEDTKNGYPIGYKINLLRVNNRKRRDIFTSSCPDLGPPNTVLVASSQATSYEIHNLRKYTQYRISVLLYNSAGDGPSSPSYTATTPGDVPGIPRLLKPTPYTDLADIIWLPPCEPNGNIIGYQLVYSEVGGRQLPLISISRHDRSYRLAPLSKETQYTMSLAAITLNGPGLAAKASFETLPSAQLPGQPGRPIARGNNPDSITLQWIDGFNGYVPFTNYIIEARTSDGAAWSHLQQVNPNIVYRNRTTTWHTITGLNPSSTYMFRIIAVNRVGKSSPSEASILIKTGARTGGEEFYQKIWFIVLIAVIVFLIIVIILVCCCVYRRGKRKAKYVGNGGSNRPPGYGFSSFEMALVRRQESEQRLIPKDDPAARNGSASGGAKPKTHRKPTEREYPDEKKDNLSVSSVSKHSDISDNDADKSADETEDERRRNRISNGPGIASHYAHDPFHRSWRNSLDKKTRKALMAEYQKVKGNNATADNDNNSIADSLLERRRDPMSASEENLERPRRRPGRPDETEKKKLTQSEPDLLQDSFDQAPGTSSFSPQAAARPDLPRKPGRKPIDRTVARSEPSLVERETDSDSDPYASSSSKSKTRRKNSFLRATHGSNASMEKPKSKKDLAEELDRKLDYLWQAPPPYDSEEPPSDVYDSETNHPPAYSPDRKEARREERGSDDSHQPLLGGSADNRGRQWRPQRRQPIDDEEPPEYHVDMDRRSVPTRHSDHLDGPISSQTLV